MGDGAGLPPTTSAGSNLSVSVIKLGMDAEKRALIIGYGTSRNMCHSYFGRRIVLLFVEILLLSFMLCDSYHNLYIGLQPFLEEDTL